MMEEKAQPHAMVKWVEGLQFVARDDRGHAFVVDTTTDVGGLNQGITPGRLLLIALAGCTGMDVISILKKKQQKVSSFEVAVWGDQAPDYPRKFVKIKVEYRIKAKDIETEAVERAIRLSEEKYCLIRATLIPQVQITSSYTIEGE